MNRQVAAGLMLLLSPLVMGLVVIMGIVIFGAKPDDWYGPVAWVTLCVGYWVLAILLVAGKEGRGWSA